MTSAGFFLSVSLLALSQGPPDFSMLHTRRKRGGPGTRLHVLDVTNVAKIINVGVVNRNAGLKFYRDRAMASTKFDGLQ